MKKKTKKKVAKKPREYYYDKKKKIEQIKKLLEMIEDDAIHIINEYPDLQFDSPFKMVVCLAMDLNEQFIEHMTKEEGKDTPEEEKK